ncbi:hypothetical protein Syun_000192 [Stephania yunnanensis]|uniref:Uncharacterized protein n=1 Tax=Stephania yunnanensis TaxID=152371 RepID=A0AAP0Q533_9MAGN
MCQARAHLLRQVLPVPALVPRRAKVFPLPCQGVPRRRAKVCQGVYLTPPVFPASRQGAYLNPPVPRASDAWSYECLLNTVEVVSSTHGLICFSSNLPQKPMLSSFLKNLYLGLSSMDNHFIGYICCGTLRFSYFETVPFILDMCYFLGSPTTALTVSNKVNFITYVCNACSGDAALKPRKELTLLIGGKAYHCKEVTLLIGAKA